MFPLRDENPPGSVPVVTRVLIVLNCAAFIYELGLGAELQRFMFTWGMVPLRITLALREGSESPLSAALPLLSSVFLHGGWTHLIGNMWYLWIFGDNVEDRLGKLRYLLFYLGAGVAAGLLHLYFNPLSRVPAVGASGAIAGVLGAYLLAFPGARVITLVPLFPFFQLMALPAGVVLGFWFVFQFFSGTLSLAWTTASSGGTAWWGHVGGFVFGFVAMMLMGGRRRPSRAWVDSA
jgi:membrane associated rhomboid family serine protease